MKPHLCASSLVCLALLMTLSINTSAQTTPPTTEKKTLSILALSDIKGRFAEPMCRAPKKRNIASWPRVVNYAQSIAKKKGYTPLTFNLGDSFYPGAIGRFYLQKGASGAQTLLSIMGKLPIDVHTLGNHDFGPLRPQFNHLVEMLRQSKVTVRSANLQCNTKGGHEKLCDLIGTSKASKNQPYQIIQRAGLKIGVIPFMDPEVAKIIAPDRMQGLDILDPEIILPKLVKALRSKEKVDLVILLPHLRNEASLLKMYRFLETTPGVDLVVSNVNPSGKTPNKTHNAGNITTSLTGTHITYASHGVEQLAHIELNLQRKDGRWRINALRNRIQHLKNTKKDANTSKLLQQTTERFCDKWGQPINAKHKLNKPFDKKTYQQFVLKTLQHVTETEVAILNNRAFRNDSIYPMEKTLTFEDIYTTLPFSNSLSIVKVKGSTLMAKLAHFDSGQLISAGLEKTKDVWRINGRPIDKDRRYSVAINDYLVQGGDGVFKAAEWLSKTSLQQDWSSGDVTLSSLLVHALQGGNLNTHLTSSTLSPDNFTSLYDKFLWRFLGSVTLNYQQIDVSNPGYDAAQLSTPSTAQFNATVKLQAMADSRNHRIGNTLTLNFAATRADDLDDKTEDLFIETQDVLLLTSHYDYARWHVRKNATWIPLPFVEGQLQTELDPPEERAWRQVELTGIVGAKWQITPELSMQLGANMRSDVNNPSDDLNYGLHVGYQWTRHTLMTLFEAPLQFESNLNYFYNDLGGENIQELRNANKIYYALLEHIFLTSSIDVFANRNATVGQWGTSVDFKLGINAIWDGTLQTF